MCVDRNIDLEEELSNLLKENKTTLKLRKKCFEETGEMGKEIHRIKSNNSNNNLGFHSW